MKKSIFLVVFSLLAFTMVFMTSCNSNTADGAKEEARESLATTPNETATPASQVTAANQTTVPAGPVTTITFDETTFDFGDVDEGEKVSHIYKFTNTGDEPLVISNAKGSCGCTVPKWPKNPIAPGETGELLVEFNTKGKPNKQTKRVTVTANTDPAQTFITITGNVKKAAAEQPSK
jgi:hypothetical protein